MARPSLSRFIIEQAFIGALLGALLAGVLLEINSRQIYLMIASHGPPGWTIAVFVAVSSAFFAVGAGLTGFLFKVSAEEP